MVQEPSARPQAQQTPMTHKQRAKKSRTGENAARAILGMPPVSDDVEQRQNPSRHHTAAPRENFSSPTEFFAGPRRAPHPTSGVRRVSGAEQDTVGQMLTEEYFMSKMNNRSGGAAKRTAPPPAAPEGSEAYGMTAKRGDGANRQRAARNKANKAANAGGATAPAVFNDCLAHNCSVMVPEREWRSGVKITHQQGAMDPPYCEDDDERPPRDIPSATGKRRVKPPYKDSKLFGQMKPIEEGDDDMEGSMPPCHKKSNKANESVDVLNLYCYTAEELQEKRDPRIQLGPRAFVAPEMPAKKPPVIKPIRNAASQEHDVLGTGRWGVPEKERQRGVARGSCRPPHDVAQLIAGGYSNQQPTKAPISEEAQRANKLQSKKNSGASNLLRYYDPAVDPTPQPAPKQHASRSNMECKMDDSNTPQHNGKGRGEFSTNGKSTISLTYATPSVAA